MTEGYVSDGTLVDTIRVEQGDHNRGNASVSCSWMLFTLLERPNHARCGTRCVNGKRGTEMGRQKASAVPASCCGAMPDCVYIIHCVHMERSRRCGVGVKTNSGGERGDRRCCDNQSPRWTDRQHLHHSRHPQHLLSPCTPSQLCSSRRR